MIWALEENNVRQNVTHGSMDGTVEQSVHVNMMVYVTIVMRSERFPATVLGQVTMVVHVITGIVKIQSTWLLGNVWLVTVPGLQLTVVMFLLVSACVCLVTKVTSVKRNARCRSMVATVRNYVNVHMVIVILSQEYVQDVIQGI